MGSKRRRSQRWIVERKKLHVLLCVWCVFLYGRFPYYYTLIAKMVRTVNALLLSDDCNIPRTICLVVNSTYSQLLKRVNTQRRTGQSYQFFQTFVGRRVSSSIRCTEMWIEMEIVDNCVVDYRNGNRGELFCWLRSSWFRLSCTRKTN